VQRFIICLVIMLRAFFSTKLQTGQSLGVLNVDKYFLVLATWAKFGGYFCRLKTWCAG